ncbi:MAG: hypothetical protein HRF52_07730 [Ignavibacterium sp.]|jgi:regulator of cell morphogenesis and NO signaling|uniref:hemerythrin domain-containing protein n=1 Tax=Ignavibacterium sp. TaxID=2651167 RepID=UPI0032999A59
METEIDVLTEELIRFHKSLIDEKTFFGDLWNEESFPDKSLWENLKRLFKELKLHIYKEEKILFPYLINLSKAFRKEIPFERPYFESVNNPIEIMKSDHELIFENLNQIKMSISGRNFNSNEERQILKKLKEFVDEVESIVYLENKILFPRAIQIEKSLLK